MAMVRVGGRVGFRPPYEAVTRAFVISVRTHLPVAK